MDINALVQQREQELAQIYNPQVDLIRQQQAALPGQFAGQRSSLEQAKTNAFRDVSQTANRRGMFFSGFQPAEQARYLGEKFLPGMQDIEARQSQARLGLLEQMNKINATRRSSIADYRDQLGSEQRKMQEAERQRQLQAQLEREKMAQDMRLAQQRSSGGGGGGSRGGLTAGQALAEQNRQAAQYKMERKSGNSGFAFTGPNGRPVSMAEFAQNTGTDIRNLLAQSPSKYDQNALATVRRLQGWNASQQAIENTLRQNFPLLF